MSDCITNNSWPHFFAILNETFSQTAPSHNQPHVVLLGGVREWQMRSCVDAPPDLEQETEDFWRWQCCRIFGRDSHQAFLHMRCATARLSLRWRAGHRKPCRGLSRQFHNEMMDIFRIGNCWDGEQSAALLCRS